jgi:hypothetical protein
MVVVATRETAPCGGAGLAKECVLVSASEAGPDLLCWWRREKCLVRKERPGMLGGPSSGT